MKAMKLPTPSTTGGKPLMEVLAARASSREFRADALDLNTLSNLLWATAGVNRADGGRTAPTARNWQEIDVLVAAPEGIFRYNPKEHSLEDFLAGDHRAATGRQDFAAVVPVNLIFVADYALMGDRPQEQKAWFAATDTAFMVQNAYLFCAQEGLATVIRNALEKEPLNKLLGLPANKTVTLVQSVGYKA
jgi:nitroreductase